MTSRRDVWATGAAYEPYVGRWSRLVAQEFMAWLPVPAGMRWLDVGCGTGALSQSIVEHAGPRELVGADPSTGYVEYARLQVQHQNVRFEVGELGRCPTKTAPSTRWFPD